MKAVGINDMVDDGALDIGAIGKGEAKVVG